MITIEAAALARAMKNAAAVVESKSHLPILANVRLIAEGEVLRLTTSDLDVQFEQLLPARVGEALATTVDARRLADMAGAAAPGAQMELKLVAETGGSGARLQVKAGRARWLLPVIAADLFPEFQVEPFQHAASLPGKRLHEVLGRVAPAMLAGQTVATRPYLAGVFWHDEGGHAAALASDAHRLVRVEIAEAEWPKGAEEVILAAKFVRLVQSLCNDLAEPVTLRWHEKLARLEVGDAVLTGKTVVGPFIPYRKFLPAPGETPVSADPAEIVAALRRIRLAAGDKERSVRFARSTDLLQLSCTSDDSSAADEEVPVQCAAAPPVGFNSSYLLDMLAAIGGETIEIDHNGVHEGVLFRRVPADGALGMLLTMRI